MATNNLPDALQFGSDLGATKGLPKSNVTATGLLKKSENGGYTSDDLFFVTDKSGNPVGAAQGLDPAMVNASKKGQQNLYYNPTKGITTESGSKISLDKKTGKITVESSYGSLTGERAKEVINQLGLDTLSANYKADPNYKYPVSEGSDKTQSIEDIIASYNKANETTGLNVIDTYGLYYQNVDNQAALLRSTHQQINEDGSITQIDFTDDDILNYFTNQEALKKAKSTSNDALTDDTRLSIPAEVIKNSGLRMLESWDEETQTVGLKEFMERIYNRQTKDWEKRQEKNPTTGSVNLDLYNALEQYITGQSGELVNGRMVYTHKDYETNQLATAISLYNFLTQTDPLCSFWQGAGDLIASGFNALGTIVTNIGQAGGVAEMFLLDAAAWTGARLRDVIGKPVQNEKDRYPSRLIAKWAGYGRGQSFYEVSGSIREQGFEKLQENISKYNSAAAGVYTVTEFLGEMAVMIATGNAFANAAVGALGKAAAGVARGAQWLSQAAAGSQLGMGVLTNLSATANGLATLWQLTGNMAQAASSTLNLVSKALSYGAVTDFVSVLAESAGEALIQNPGLLGEILAEDNLTEEARQFAIYTVAGNALGMGVGHGASKALMKLGDTTVGSAVSRNLNRIVWSVKTWAGDSLDAARVALSKYDTIEEIIKHGKATKFEARMNRQLIKALQKEAVQNTDFIKLLGQSSEEIAEQVAKYDKELTKVFNLENALDWMSNRGFFTAAAMVSDPNVALSGSYKSFREISSELIDMGKKAGMKATSIGDVSLLPDKVKDYITSKQHLDILKAYKAAIENGYDVGESLSAIEKEITHFTGVVDELTESLGTDFVAKSDQFIDANRKLWSDWTDYRVEKGLLSEAQVNALRESEKWGLGGELYVGQMRQVKQPKYARRRTDNLQDVKRLEELGSYKFGSTDGFVDPILTFQNSLYRSAQDYDRLMVMDQFRGTDAVTVKFTAQQMELVESVNAGKKALFSGVQEAFSQQMESILTGKLLTNVGDLRFASEGLEYTAKELMEAEVTESVSSVVDGMYDLLSTGNTKVSRMLEAMVNQYAPDMPDVAKKFLIYGAVQDNIDGFNKQLRAALTEELSTMEFGERILKVNELNELADDITTRVTDEIKTRFDWNRVELSRAAGRGKNLINYEEWYDETRELAKEIGDVKANGSNIVIARNAAGEMEMYQCSPLIATFMNVEGTRPQMSDSVLAKMNYAWMRLFRFGTTGPNPVSWVNQFFRDFGNAWLVGGATKTISQSVDVLEEAFGANPAYYLSQFSEEFIEEASIKAKETGKTLERVLAESEVEYGRKTVASQTEAESLKQYRRLKNARYSDGEIEVTTLSRAAEKADETMQWFDGLNNARESWLRTRVFANNYAKAIKQGKTVSQARTWAQFYASNATTNFTRATSFLAGIQHTIPYLRSAINGTKSFWRLWQVDPVGVTGRIVGGLVIPMFGLYALTLSDEENRAVYRNIKEYQKDNSLAFVVGGQAYFLPIPQEIGSVIAPIRQIIESMYDVSTNSFSELAFSDILGLSPLDLSGFAALDNYKIYEDGWWERMQGGVTKLAAQILPKYANTLVAVATNRDLYTGNKIDSSYTTIDPDTGEARVMDYTSGQAAKALHKVFPGLSAAMAENIMKNTIGQVGIGVGNFIVDLFTNTEGISGRLENVVSGLAGAVTSPLTGYVTYDEAETAFRRAVSEMYEYREQLRNSDEYQAYIKNYGKASTDAQIDALAVQRQNIVEPYFEKVKSMVDGYIKGYGRQLTQEQLASTISLMVLFQNTDVGNPILDQANTDAYQAARASALSTMNRLGFANAGSQDSIFGRIRTSSNGSVYVEYNNPIAVLDFRKTLGTASSRHQAQIESILSDAGLTRSKMFEDYNKATTKAQKKQAKQNWNAKVIKALKPYINEFGPKAVISNQETVDLLERYIFVDNPYGAKAYLQKIFGDTK